MGNSSGRLVVSRKATNTKGDTTKPVDEKNGETHTEAVDNNGDIHTLDKENVEPVVTIVEGDVETKEHSSNGHNGNGHTNGHCAKDEETNGAETTANGKDHSTATTEVIVEVVAKEEGTATSHNASTASESKRSNPLKWLKKNISFKKEKRSKKKDTSAVEEEKPAEEATEAEANKAATEVAETPETPALETPKDAVAEVAVAAVVVEISAAPQVTDTPQEVEIPSQPAPEVTETVAVTHVEMNGHHVEMNGHHEEEATTAESTTTSTVTEETTHVVTKVLVESHEVTEVVNTPDSQPVECNGE